MANLGEKSMTIVQEMVMMLFFSPSFIVINTTGPGSISVNALLMGIVFITVYLMLFAKIYSTVHTSYNAGFRLGE